MNLRAGELVEVRSRDEILATLDEQGRLEALPEMLQFCGQRFRVFKRADKTCDTIEQTGTRRMYHTVHLDGLRCDGQAHGGCQMRCLLFWKEAWLKRAAPGPAVRPFEVAAPQGAEGCTEEALHRAVHVSGADPGSKGERYACQATELLRATWILKWWDVRQYIRDVRSKNVRLGDIVRGIAIAIFNTIQRRRGGRRYPHIRGTLTKTPVAVLGLRPGDEVRVKPKEEILETLDVRRRNRGLYFDPEMVRYCGRTFKVLARPERIIDERTGRMLTLPTECIVLDGATCVGDLSIHPNRLFCPRSIHSFWREIWLERVGGRRESEGPTP
ncbi:MAG: hypothetical protein GEV06_10835 [Luteitalea sp.]|nr:hypothetical protein [Luteitalea sp.]